MILRSSRQLPVFSIENKKNTSPQKKEEVSCHSIRTKEIRKCSSLLKIEDRKATLRRSSRTKSLKTNSSTENHKDNKHFLKYKMIMEMEDPLKEENGEPLTVKKEKNLNKEILTPTRTTTRLDKTPTKLQHHGCHCTKKPKKMDLHPLNSIKKEFESEKLPKEKHATQLRLTQYNLSEFRSPVRSLSQLPICISLNLGRDRLFSPYSYERKRSSSFFSHTSETQEDFKFLLESETSDFFEMSSVHSKNSTSCSLKQKYEQEQEQQQHHDMNTTNPITFSSTQTHEHPTHENPTHEHQTHEQNQLEERMQVTIEKIVQPNTTTTNLPLNPTIIPSKTHHLPSYSYPFQLFIKNNESFLSAHPYLVFCGICIFGCLQYYLGGKLDISLPLGPLAISYDLNLLVTQIKYILNLHD